MEQCLCLASEVTELLSSRGFICVFGEEVALGMDTHSDN